jgi:hypothetical protein
MNRKEALDGLREDVARTKVKYSKKNKKDIQYIGIPKANGDMYNRAHSGCILEQSNGMLRNIAIPGKQRYIFSDKCYSASFDYLNLDDLEIIIQHDFDYAIFEIFGQPILQLNGGCQGSQVSPGICPYWAMLREQKLLSSLTPEEQSFPRLLDRFMDDEYTILYLNDPAFGKFSESDIYAPYCTAEASDTNEFLSQGSLWIDDKLCFYPISPNRHNLLRYGKLQFFRFINGYSNMNEQQQKSTCIGTIIFTIDSMTESAQIGYALELFRWCSSS